MRHSYTQHVQNSEPHSFFRSSSFLKILVLLLLLWTTFFGYWYSIHKNEHLDRLEKFVQQSLELQKSGPIGDELSPRQMMVELSEPNTLILKELESWDKWMSSWLDLGLMVQMILVVTVSILLCTHFVPKDSVTSLSESADKRKKLPAKPVRLFFHFSIYILFFITNRSTPVLWQFDLQRVIRGWEIYLIPYAETYVSLSLFFSNLWPNNLAELFDARFGAVFIGWIVVVQMLIAVILCFPLFFKTDPEEPIPDDVLGPDERILRFPEERERKIVDRWF